MPARIDPEQRRQQIMEAAFRLVVAEGIQGVTLRKVADESSLNIGSVRHCFHSHHDLLTAAAEEAGNRMGERLADHPIEALRGLRGDAALGAVQTLIEAVLPIDEARHEQTAVILELIMASRTMPVFHAPSERMGRDLIAILREAFEALGLRDAELAAEQIVATIGGLTIGALTPHGGLSVDRLGAVLRSHLRMLLADQG